MVPMAWATGRTVLMMNLKTDLYITTCILYSAVMCIVLFNSQKHLTG